MMELRHWMRLLETEGWSDKLWNHYTDHPMVTFNRKGFHQDPLGIYFFPADHIPSAAQWHEKAYKFVARLKPETRVLNLDTIRDDELYQLLDLTGCRAKFDAYIAQYPPKSSKDRIHMAWTTMRDHYMRMVPIAWTKAIMRGGWDAIYDGRGVIHAYEPQQLLVVNPRVIKLVDMQRMKMPIFVSMKKVTNDIAKLAAPYGTVEVEGPKRTRDRYSTKWILEATVRVARSQSNYITIVIHYHDEAGFRTQIQASVRYASPSLNSGAGATYKMTTGDYDSYGNLNQLRWALDKVFAPVDSYEIA